MTTLRNRYTGEVITIDRHVSRLSRLRRRVHAWSEALKGFQDEGDLLMITLTYRPGDEWRPNDIREFMLNIRARYGSRILAYAWVAEMQQRGAVHYHVLLMVPKGFKVEYPDKSGLWLHGMTQVTKARTVFYICSYTGKEYQKDNLPCGIRMFALWISKRFVSKIAFWHFKLSVLPGWLREIILNTENTEGRWVWARLKRGGFLCGDGLEYFALRSPYYVLGLA